MCTKVLIQLDSSNFMIKLSNYVPFLIPIGKLRI